jgi:hypothetical protein
LERVRSIEREVTRGQWSLEDYLWSKHPTYTEQELLAALAAYETPYADRGGGIRGVR